MADGSLTIVAGQGDIFLNKHLTLKNILHVPKLFTNLISIQKLTSDANCHVISYPTFCEFQEQNTKKMIGHARAKAELYNLETSGEQANKRKASPTSFLVQSNND